MSDVNLSISQDVVKPIIESKIQAAIIRELEGASGIMERIVSRVLMAKVDEQGRESCYARDTTFVQWVCQDAIRNATIAAVKQAVEEMKPTLVKLIVKDLEKRKGEIAGALVGFFVNATESYYRIKADVTIIPGKD